jgi:pimeloyl-ACP methyl ester carboxylesterase
MGGVIGTLTLPRLGETMDEARVTTWIVAEGAAFKRGDVLLEVETDKTVVEVPALQDGILVRRLVAEGDTVALGAPIAEVESAQAMVPAEATVAAAAPVSVPVDNGSATIPDVAEPALVDRMASRSAASPAARALARQSGVSLALVDGTGRRGRITGEDVARSDSGAAKPVVVLIHGLFDAPEGWRDLPRKLRALGHAVVTPSLPGHHATSVVPDERLESVVERFIDDVLPALPSGRLVVCGHSVGAMFAVRLALALRSRTERVILSAPAGLGMRINQEFIDGMLGAHSPAALERALAFLGGGPVSTTVLAAELERIAASRDAMAILARLTAIAGVQQADCTKDIEKLAVPVSALFGVDDRIVDWQDCAALPAHAAVHLARNAGHLPHLAHSALFIQLLAGAAGRATTQRAM